MKVKQLASVFIVLFATILEGPVSAQDLFFDWPINVDSYNPYSFGRPLGASGNHSGEDIALPAGTSICPVGDGIIRLYKKNSCNGCPYCGYGMLYAVVHHSLSRSLRVPIGVNTFIYASDFSFVYGHISNYEDPINQSGGFTGFEINSSYRNEYIANDNIIGYTAPNGPECTSSDLNGDGAEHLHLGAVVGLIDQPYVIPGYGYPGAYLPAHLVM